MLQTAFLVLGGLAALLIGGDALVRGAVGLARHFNVPTLLIGLTIVSIGASAPELAVSLVAGADGHAGIVLGNVVGSNICNIGLVLGLVALMRPLAIDRRLVVREVPALLAATAGVLFMLADGALGLFEGLVLVSALAAYLVFGFRGGRRLEVADGALPAGGRASGPGRAALLIVAGLVGLLVGGDWLVDGAVVLARAAGLSEAIIGITIIAIGTSLPELVASLMAIRSGEADLAVGNVVGSNLFNLLGILGLSAGIFGVQRTGLGWGDLGVMAGLTFILFPMIVTARRLVRWEAALLIFVYVVYLASLALVPR